MLGARFDVRACPSYPATCGFVSAFDARFGVLDPIFPTRPPFSARKCRFPASTDTSRRLGVEPGYRFGREEGVRWDFLASVEHRKRNLAFVARRLILRYGSSQW
uniref:Uncharacterized protein n=1 Tax=mine drainage metagenome TaxID=410659 RepID=E6QWT6_9ZZZZ